jgi:hypothetical protein
MEGFSQASPADTLAPSDFVFDWPDPESRSSVREFTAM